MKSKDPVAVCVYVCFVIIIIIIIINIIINSFILSSLLLKGNATTSEISVHCIVCFFLFWRLDCWMKK